MNFSYTSWALTLALIILTQAPGEAEAELAQLNKLGFIDVVITEDSDALAFGATCVLRTSGFVHFIHGLSGGFKYRV
jgi:5'-3' exonuclease